MKNFLRIHGFVKPYIIRYLIGLFAYASQNFAFPLITGIVMSSVVAAMLNGSMTEVYDALILFAILLVGFFVLIGVGTYFWIMTIEYAKRDLSRSIFRAFIKNNNERLTHSGEGFAALNTDADTALGTFGAITPFVQDVLAIIVASTTIFVLDWRIGLVTFGVGLVFFFIQSRFAKPLSKIGKETLNENAEAVKDMTNIFSGALTIRTFNRQDRAFNVFDVHSNRLRFLGFKQAFISMFQSMFSSLSEFSTILIVFAIGGWLVASGIGDLQFHHLMLVFPLVGAINRSISRIGSSWAMIQPPLIAVQRVFDVIDSAPETKNKKSQAWDNKYELNINGLEFFYKDTEEPALKDISLNIKENEMIAIVGPSGSGKSTLLRTIVGLYERDNLPISIGNMAFNDLHSWRACFAYVDQSAKLFDMTIHENIALGKTTGQRLCSCTGECICLEEVTGAAKRAFAHDFIMESGGYDKRAGELSGGQRQRLAIARALYRKAPILVFDEATSSLDPESERNVMDTILDLRRDHTILITTHNLSNIETADKIIVMDGGKIAEIGTHDSLMEKKGIYYNLIH